MGRPFFNRKMTQKREPKKPKLQKFQSGEAILVRTEHGQKRAVVIKSSKTVLARVGKPVNTTVNLPAAGISTIRIQTPRRLRDIPPHSKKSKKLLRRRINTKIKSLIESRGPKFGDPQSSKRREKELARLRKNLDRARI